MLHIIKSLEDQLATLIKDDPVRPEIPLHNRVNENSEIYVLQDDEGNARAVTCVKFLAAIPESVEDLTDLAVNTNTAVFYTIWSYAAGAGRDLIREARASIQHHHPETTTFVTLSPKTEMAKKFHLKNGADIYRENETTVNYLYR